MSENKEIFAIFGNPVEHSKSPEMHNAGFENINYNAEYKKHLLEDGETIKEVFLNANYKGANITVPHKELAYKNADEVRGLANEIKAANTYIKEDGKVIAYNTDAPGFLYAIESFGELKKVLILGAGGTAKAISLALQQSDIDVTVLNRSEGKLGFFKEHDIKAFTWDEFEAQNYDLIVNSTSAGLKDEHLPCPEEILEKVLKNASCAFDCVYGKITPFLQKAQEKNLQTKDGEDMLLYQGVLAFEYFTKQNIDDETIETMRKALKGE